MSEFKIVHCGREIVRSQASECYSERHRPFVNLAVVFLLALQDERVAIVEQGDRELIVLERNRDHSGGGKLPEVIVVICLMARTCWPFRKIAGHILNDEA